MLTSVVAHGTYARQQMVLEKVGRNKSNSGAKKLGVQCVWHEYKFCNVSGMSTS